MKLRKSKKQKEEEGRKHKLIIGQYGVQRNRTSRKLKDINKLYTRVCRRCGVIHKTRAKATGAICPDCTIPKDWQKDNYKKYYARQLKENVRLSLS